MRQKQIGLIVIFPMSSRQGKGIIAIPAELTEEFKDLLIPYYEEKDEKQIKKFIKGKCYMNI